MARRLRIEYPGALYHVTSRGNEKKNVYSGSNDKTKFLDILFDVCTECGWICHAYCLMGNHYHLLIETPEANLSEGMKLLNAIYAQFYNAVHKRVGHLWQGRFTSIVVHSEMYFLELCRYIVLNPVRSDFVEAPMDWDSSSFRATAGYDAPHKCLTVDFILDSFDKNRKIAKKNYEQFVLEGIGREPVWKYLRKEMILGNDDFVRSLLNKVSVGIRRRLLAGLKRSGRPTLEDLFSRYGLDSKIAITKAIRTHLYTQAEVASFLGVSRSYINKLVC